MVRAQVSSQTLESVLESVQIAVHFPMLA